MFTVNMAKQNRGAKLRRSLEICLGKKAAFAVSNNYLAMQKVIIAHQV